MPRRDQAHTITPQPTGNSPVQDVAVHKGVSLGVVLTNFKVGIEQESTVDYCEPVRHTQLAGLTAGRGKRLIRAIDIPG